MIIVINYGHYIYEDKINSIRIDIYTFIGYIATVIGGTFLAKHIGIFIGEIIWGD